MNRTRHLAHLAALAALALSVRQASAQSVVRDRDEASRDPGQESARTDGNGKDPIRGSTFIFDQATTTQTLHLEPSPQLSYVPFYEWWLSLRPRWNFSDKLRLQGRFDYYKELTNSQATTNYREDVFGDFWTDLIYATPLAATGRLKDTKVSVGARALWPTSKQSQGQGTYVGLGATGAIAEKINLRGEGAPIFNSARVGMTWAYLHPFTTGTTPTDYGNFGYVRENVEGYSFVSDQLTGQPIVNHTLYAIFDTGLQITPKVGLTLDMIWINQWHYLLNDATGQTSTGRWIVPRSPDDQQFTQLFWLVVAVDYELFEEVSLGLGYYNLANVLSPDGTVRGPFAGGQDNLFWSPDARVFFDVTANLDRIFEDATGHRSSRVTRSGRTAEAARDASGHQVVGE